MVVSFICFVMVLIKLGCTRPRLASSLNSVTGPSRPPVSTAAAATCCHGALLWKPTVGTLETRDEGRRSALVALSEDTRSDVEQRAAVGMLRESVAGHLRSAANIVKRKFGSVDFGRASSVRVQRTLLLKRAPREKLTGNEWW